MSSFQNIAPEELQSRLDEVLLVDVRGPSETVRGVIKGSQTDTVAPCSHERGSIQNRIRTL